MALANRLAKLLIDPAFRHPELLRIIFALDDACGIDLVKALAPFKLLPASRTLFTRCFAHFVAGEQISFAAASRLADCAPGPAERGYLQRQAAEERAHEQHFRAKLTQFGIAQERLDGAVAPRFRRLGALIDERTAAGDYAAGVIGNNVVVEGLAICLLELGCRSLRANSDEIGAFMDRVLADERHHVRFGERTLAKLARRDGLDARAAQAFYDEMWSAVGEAVAEIPEVVDALGLTPVGLLGELRAFYGRRFTAAALPLIA